MRACVSVNRSSLRLRRAASFPNRPEPCYAARMMATRVTLLLVVALALAQLACPPPRPNPLVVGPEPTRSADADADFTLAVAAYEAAAFGDAVQQFRLFLATHPGDVRAIDAELYLGRALAADGQTLEAARVFEGLHQAPETVASRRAAVLYRAFVASLRGESAYGRQLLVDELGADPEITVARADVLEGDVAVLAILLAEACVDTEDLACALAHWWLAAEQAATEDLRVLAVERAVAAVAEEDLRRLREWFGGENPLAVAAVTPLLVSEALIAGDLDAAREVVAGGAPALAAYGLLNELERLQSATRARDGATARTYGVLVPLSGPNVRAGRAALGAVLLAQRAFEGREPASIVRIADVGSSPREAARATEQLIDAGALAIIGPIVPELVDASREVAARRDVPLIALSSAPFDAEVAHTYRWMIDASAEADALAEAALGRGARRAVIVGDAEHSPYLAAFALAARNAGARAGIEVVESLELESDAADGQVLQQSAAAAARAIARTGADTVWLATTADQAATLVAYLASEDIWPSPDGSTRSAAGRRQVNYLGHSFLLDTGLLLNSSRYLEGALFSSWFDAEQAVGDARAFADRFLWTYGRLPGVIEAFAYDASMRVRSLLLERGVRTPAEVDRALRDEVASSPVLGEMAFDTLGNPRIRPALVRVVGGAFVRDSTP